jgi:hypothetical protein
MQRHTGTKLRKIFLSLNPETITKNIHFDIWKEKP